MFSGVKQSIETHTVKSNQYLRATLDLLECTHANLYEFSARPVLKVSKTTLNKYYKAQHAFLINKAVLCSITSKNLPLFPSHKKISNIFRNDE